MVCHICAICVQSFCFFTLNVKNKNNVYILHLSIKLLFKKMSNLSSHQRSLIIEMAQEGKPYKDIARQLNIHRNTVSNTVRTFQATQDHGWQTPRMLWTPLRCFCRISLDMLPLRHAIYQTSAALVMSQLVVSLNRDLSIGLEFESQNGYK